MSKIYVITSGCYSDYHICGVATDIEKANLLAKRFSDYYNKAQVEEYDTDDMAEYLRFPNTYICKYIEDTKRIIVRKSDYTYPENSDFKISKTMYGLFVYVNADNEEMALKKASDMFAKYKAEKLGL